MLRRDRGSIAPCQKDCRVDRLGAVSAHPSSRPLRLLLALLLVGASFWAGPIAARRERGDTKSSCIATRAAVLRPPACRGVPDVSPLSAALPPAGPALPTPRIV